MSIVKIDDFTRHSVSPNVCFALRRPLSKDDKCGFRLGDIMMERGTVEISASAAQEMAMQLNWRSPKEWNDMLADNIDRVVALENEIEYLREKVKDFDGLKSTVKLLSADLEVANCVRDDAIAQFQALEAANKAASAPKKTTSAASKGK